MSVNRSKPRRYRTVIVVAMGLAESTWLALLLMIGWRLGSGWWLGAVLSLGFGLTFLIIWGRWMAPQSRHRLSEDSRPVLLVLISSSLIVIAALAGLFMPAAISSLVLLWAHHCQNATTST